MKNRLNISTLITLFIGICLGSVLVCTVAVFTSSTITPFDSSSLDTSRGKSLFRQSCSSCHSIQQSSDGGYGPNLFNIGLVASKRIEGVHAQDYILESILRPDAYQVEGSGHMPRGTVDGEQAETVRSLVGYLASLGGSVDTDHLKKLVIDNDLQEIEVVAADIEKIQRGWTLFYGELRCSSCHAINVIPGSELRAPSLSKAGLLSDDYIRSSIRTPSEFVADIWRPVDIALKSGRTLSGRVIYEDVTSYVLLHSGDGENRLLANETITKADVLDYDVSEVSVMPEYSLSPEDENALVAFLKSLVAEH